MACLSLTTVAWTSSPPLAELLGAGTSHCAVATTVVRPVAKASLSNSRQLLAEILPISLREIHTDEISVADYEALHLYC